tara:strand:- start:981 stop:1337 length:357 start_codon:yes stop_codon:yes gene_type:complete
MLLGICIFAKPLTKDIISCLRTLFVAVIALSLTSCWKDKSPEDLIRLKDKFKSQVNAFEDKKEIANKNINKDLESLNALKSTLEDTKNEDKEFAKVYGDWEKVDRREQNLNKEYDDLK